MQKSFKVIASLLLFLGLLSAGGNPTGPAITTLKVGVDGSDQNDFHYYGQSGGIAAYSIATTSCNPGTQHVQWTSSDHPVIGQNIFRLKDGRFEQLGQSWLKHGFCAVNESGCGSCQSTSCSTLGVGCADTYWATLNDGQGGGPKFEVNPTTGDHQDPNSNPSGNSTLRGRLQVPVSEIDPNQNGNSSADYFAEAQYISQHVMAAGNGAITTSYRKLNVISTTNIDGGGPTVVGDPAVFAWKAEDAQVDVQDVYNPGEGPGPGSRYVVGQKVTDLGGGAWRYDYVVQNINSDRGAYSFAVPVGASVGVSNVFFRDVDYHSGEPFSNADWVSEQSGGMLTFHSTQTHGQNANANALRWGTMYTFGFDADAPPSPGMGELAMFKPTGGGADVLPVAVESPGCELATISAHPQDQTVCPGDPASFSVTASGAGPFTYQWRLDGVDLSGETADQLMIPAAGAGDVGDYTVRVTNPCGALESDPAALALLSGAPVVTADPVSQSVCQGSPVSFDVSASGDGPFTYQWFHDGAPIPGATADTYSIASAQSADAGDYAAEVTSSCGTTPSATAILGVVTAAPSIVSGPVGDTVCAGESVLFTVSASGPGLLTYQWFLDGAPIPGATADQHSIASAGVGDAGDYTVAVSNECGSDTSAPATLAVLSGPPSITTQPQPQSACAGGSVSFSVSATGDGPLAYQWLDDGVPMPGETASALMLSNVDGGDAGDYSVEVTNACGTTPSAAASLSVLSGPPSVQTPPADLSVCAGEPATFTVVATGDGALSYQWLFGGAPIPGATASDHMIPAVSAGDSGLYSVDVTNACGTTTSATATLDVLDCDPGYGIPSPCQGPVPAGIECGEDPNPDGGMESMYLAGGELVHRVIDLRIPGRGQDFVWARTYRSKLGPDTAQGNGWDFSYGKFVSQQGASMVVHDGDARADLFLPQPDGTWAKSGLFQVLRQLPDESLVLTYPDRSECHFYPLSHPLWAGKLAAIFDRNEGNALGFEYDGLGRLTTIHDTLDLGGHPRDVTIDYDADGFIASVTDWAGRSLTYDYYEDGDAGGSAGDLKSVTTQAVVSNADFPIPTGSGHEYPSGKTTTYTYSTGSPDEALNHNLLAITDPKGQTFLANEYSTSAPGSLTYDSLLAQERGGGDRFDVTYLSVAPGPSNGDASLRVIVNDPVGNVSEYFFDDLDRCVLAQDFTGRAPNADAPTTAGGNRPTGQLRPGDPAVFETWTQYNGDSRPTLTVRPNGNETLRVYELDLDGGADRRARGNLREVQRTPGTHVPGGPPAIVETFEYDSSTGTCCGSNFVTRHVDGRGNETMHAYDASGNRTQTVHPVASVVEDFEYDLFGSQTAHLHPDDGTGHRRRDEFTYYGTGHQNGYLATETVDAGGFALTTTYEYDLVGNRRRVVDPLGHDRLFVFNQLDQVVRTTSPEVEPGSGVRYDRTFVYDPNDNVVRLDVENRGADGALGANEAFTTVREYDELDRLVRECEEVGDFSGAIPGTPEQPSCAGLPRKQFRKTELEYDGNDNRVVTRSGEAVEGRQADAVVQGLFDERDLLFQLARGAGGGDASTTQHDYDGNGNVVRVATGLEAGEREALRVYDGYDRLLSETDPTGNERSFEYDGNDNVVSERVHGELQDAPGGGSNVRLAEIARVYDELDRLVTETAEHFDPATQAPVGDGQSTRSTTWSGTSRVLIETDDNGHATTFEYDSAGRERRVVDAAGNSLERTYDDASRVIVELETERSDLGNPDQGFTTTYAYDGLDRRVLTTDNVGNERAAAYDARDLLVEETDALGYRVEHRYDGLGRRVETSRPVAGGGAFGGLVFVRFGWDDNDRRIAVTDAAGHLTRFTYDGLDRLTTTRHAGGGVRRSTYDAHGDELTTEDPNGTQVAATYDALGRVVGRTVSPGAGVSGQTSFETYTYDGLSRVVQASDDQSAVTRAHDSLDNCVLEDIDGSATTGTFDGVGNRLSVTYPGGRTIESVYDALDRVITVTESPGPLLVEYDYVGPDRIERREHANGTRASYTYDGITGVPNPAGDLGVRRAIETLHELDPGGAATVIERRTYLWSARQQKLRRKDLRPASPELSHDYTYDSLGRLTRTVVRDFIGGTVRNERYVYDLAGNRTEVTGGADPGVYTCVPDDCASNLYTTTPFESREYDANGNLTRLDVGQPSERRLTYDFRDRLVEHEELAGGRMTRYSYDALDRLVALVDDATGLPTTTDFSYLDGSVCEEQDGFGGTVATYVLGSRLDGAVGVRRGPADYTYHEDDLGNVMAVTDALGAVVERYEYGDFGAPEVFTANGASLPETAIGNALLFGGARFDASTDWYLLGARVLHPRAGRYNSLGAPDALGNAATFEGNTPWSAPLR